MLSDGKIRQVYRHGRNCYTHQRSQKIYPFKKRKFFNRMPLATPDRGFNCESIFNSPDKRVNSDNYCAGSMMHTVRFPFSTHVHSAHYTLHLH